MASIENLTNKILSDAKAKEKEIIDSAEKIREEIISKGKRDANEAEALIISKAREEGVSKKDRIISNAALKVRNDNLEAKQKVMEQTFEKALEKLAGMKPESVKDFIKNSILNLEIAGDEVLILNQETKAYINQEFIDGINKALETRGYKGKITISPETGSFIGGYILEKNGVEINNTFEVLVTSKKDEVEFDVAELLFR
ncbi:MAG: V-type ATP synthase subunit E [Clostridiaceae bacterium]